MVVAVDFVVPGTAVPVVIADEIENAGRLHIQRDIEIVGILIEEVRRVRALVASSAIVGAAHVSARADALVGPALPLAVGIHASWNYRRLRESSGRYGEQKKAFHFTVTSSNVIQY